MCRNYDTARIFLRAPGCRPANMKAAFVIASKKLLIVSAAPAATICHIPETILHSYNRRNQLQQLSISCRCPPQFRITNKMNTKATLTTLYLQHASELRTFVRQRIGSEDAADVVHDTYLRVLQYAGRDVLKNPRAYLYRVAANVATDCGVAQKKNNERFESEADPDSFDSAIPSPESTLDSRQRLLQCLAALDELPAVYRHVFLLHRIDGLTQSEIADILGMPKRTVERYIAKTMEHCLERIGKKNI